MAKITGSVGKNGYGFYALVTETKPTNYIADNATTVNYEVYIVNGNKRTSSSGWTFNAKIDGSNVYNKTSQSLVTNDTDFNAAKKLFSGSTSVKHNNDGKKTITFSASLTKSSAYTDYDPGACSLSGSFKLTDIPRASSVTCPSGNIGEVVNIVVSKMVDTFTSTLTWECGSQSGTIATKTAEKTVPFTIPTSLYSLIPNETSKTVTIKCATYNGNTQIGSTQSTTMVARVATDTNKPSLSFTVEETNQKVINITGSATSNIGILNASIFKVKATASAKNSATIDRYVVTNGTKTVTSTSPEILMDKLENAIITVTVYDSRGISNSVNLDLTSKLVKYKIPNVTKINVKRLNQTESKVYLNLTANLYYGALTTTVNNSLTIKYKFKKVKDTSASWSAIKEVTGYNLLVDDFGDASVDIANLLIESGCEYTSAYEFEFYIEDKLNSITKTGLVVPQGIMTFGIGKENVYLNGRLKVAKNDGTSRKDLFDWIHPVGSIVYLDVPTNPKDLWGIGTWERIQGKFLLAGNDSADAYKPGASGGEVTHVLTANEMPSHTHTISSSGGHSHTAKFKEHRIPTANYSGSSDYARRQETTDQASTKRITVSDGAHTHTPANTGGGQAHNNMPPFYAVYVWKRIS